MRIIVFDLDSVRPDHLGCYGYPRPTSPNIDRIAAEGMRFEQVHCADSPCLPSRAGFISGRFGVHHGAVSNVGEGRDFRVDLTPYRGPAPAQQLLPRQLRTTGLDTVCISNFADRHSAWWFMCGWSEFLTPNLKGGSETAAEVNDAVLSWLRRNEARDDYLLYINYWDAHRTYRMDPSWADRFADHPVAQDWPNDEACARLAETVTGPFTGTGQFPATGHEPPPLMPRQVRTRAEFEHMITGYDAAIAWTDHHLGQVLDELARQGALDDAVVIITGDHGDAFGEHGIYSDHVCADACIHRVPLIVRWPGRTPAGGVDDGLHYTCDWSATLCQLLGAEVPEGWDGISFATAVEGDAGEGLARGGRDELVWSHGLYTVQRAVRTRQHLLVRTYDDDGYIFDPVELYDMTADPYQTRNLAAAEPALTTRLLERMASWVDTERERGGWQPDPLTAILAERRRA